MYIGKEFHDSRKIQRLNTHPATSRGRDGKMNDYTDLLTVTLGWRQTVYIMQTFFLAMALNPHVVRKAQEELDRILDGERLPDFSDQEDLPYISAIVKELFDGDARFQLGYPNG